MRIHKKTSVHSNSSSNICTNVDTKHRFNAQCYSNLHVYMSIQLQKRTTVLYVGLWLCLYMYRLSSRLDFFYIVYIVNSVKCTSEGEVCKMDLGPIYSKPKLGNGVGVEAYFLSLHSTHHHIPNGSYCHPEFIQKIQCTLYHVLLINPMYDFITGIQDTRSLHFYRCVPEE